MPVVLHGPKCDTENCCDLMVAEAAEHPELGKAGPARSHRTQPFDRGVEIEDQTRIGGGRHEIGGQSHTNSPPTSFGAPLPPCEVDEEPAHDQRGNTEVVVAVLPAHLLLRQSEEGVVHDRGGLRERAAMVSPALPLDAPPKLWLHQCEHSVRVDLGSRPHLAQGVRDLTGPGLVTIHVHRVANARRPRSRTGYRCSTAELSRT